jgi:hypothetical protein
MFGQLLINAVMARVRRKHQRLRSNAPIESAPGSLLSPTPTMPAGALPIES